MDYFLSYTINIGCMLLSIRHRLGFQPHKLTIDLACPLQAKSIFKPFALAVVCSLETLPRVLKKDTSHCLEEIRVSSVNRAPFPSSWAHSTMSGPQAPEPPKL